MTAEAARIYHEYVQLHQLRAMTLLSDLTGFRSSTTMSQCPRPTLELSPRHAYSSSMMMSA
jgi:hypothetical protein